MLVKVTGLTEVQEMLTTLPALLVLTAFDRALGAGGAVIQKEMESHAPPGEEGLLQSNGTVEVFVDKAARGGTAHIGYDPSARAIYSEVPADVIAHWIEYGHIMRSHQPGHYFIKHIPANPFMRNAAESASDAAIEKFADVLVDILESGVVFSGTKGGLTVITQNAIASVTTDEYLDGVYEF